VIGGKYRVDAQIGRGAMGAVFAAENTRTSRPVALKLVHAGDDAEVRERLLREARACGRISHPNVIEVIDVGETDKGEPFLVMPLLMGEPLSRRIKDGRLGVDEALAIARDVASGLAAAHAVGVVHRDLKPHNIFLHRAAPDREEEVKLLDFGVSRIATDRALTQTGVAIGSPAYMSPEQARGQKVDQRTDVWSFGVLCFQMLSGSLPFPGKTQYEQLERITLGEIPALPPVRADIDAPMSELIRRCLDRDLTTRVADIRECASILEQLQSPASPAPEPRAVAPVPGPRDDVSDGEATIVQPSAERPRAPTAPPMGLTTSILAVLAATALVVLIYLMIR